MSVTNYTQWIFNKVRGTDNAEGKRFEIRINKGTNDYDYGVANPTDCIYLDQLKIVDFGKTKWQRYDEDADMVAPSRIIEIRDEFFFSGTVTGSPLPTQSLYPEKTSLIPFIFNDPDETYHVWLSQLNSDGTLKEIYFYGQVNVPFFEGQFKRITNPMGSAEMKLQSKKILIVTASERLKDHTIEELVSGSRTNGIPDGLVAGLGLTDVFSIGGFDTKYKPWYYGVVMNKDYPHDESQNPFGFAYRRSDAPEVIVYNYDSPPSFYQCQYPSGDRANGGYVLGGYNPIGFFEIPTSYEFPFGWGNNMYGMPDGLQAISYATILAKIVAIIGATFTTSDSDNVFTEYLSNFATQTINGLAFDRYNLSSIGDPHILNVIAINYNVRFGVGGCIPNQMHYGRDTVDSSFSRVLIDSAAGTSPTTLTLHSDTELIAGVGHQRVIIKHSPYGENDTAEVFYMSVVDGTTVTLENEDGTPASWTFAANCELHYAGRSFWDISYPASFDRSKSLAEMLKIICFRFGYLIDWDINQSGASKGLPKLVLRNMLNSAGAIPTEWQSQTTPTLLSGGGISAAQLAKKNVALKYPGDDSVVYCPTKFGESISIEIHGRAKQWGRKYGTQPSDIINDATESQHDQWNTTFRPNPIEDAGHNRFLSVDFGSSRGWIPGAADFYYLDSPSSNYNNTFRLVLTDQSDWSGFYPIGYEDYGTGTLDWDAQLPSAQTIHDGRRTKDSRFNTLAAKAIYYANVFLHNVVVERRSFRTANDDSGNIRTLRPMLTGSWQDEDGVIRSHLLHSIEIDELHGICDCEFVPTPGDLVQYEVIVDTGSGAGGNTGGAGISNIGNNGNPSNSSAGFVKIAPSTDFANDSQPTADGITYHRIKDFSDTHSADKIVSTNKDGTIIYAGLKAQQGFYAKTTHGFILYNVSGTPSQIEFYNTGNTFKTILKGNTSIAADVSFTLPNADGTSGFILQTNGSGVLSFVDPSTLLTNAVTINPATALRNLITPFANGVRPIEIKGKAGSSADLILIQTSGSQDILKITSGGLINISGAVLFNAIGGATSLSLDTGSGFNNGNSGDILTSGGTGGLLAWVTQTSLLTTAIIIDPLTDVRNLINPSGDHNGLIIRQGSGSIKDNLEIQTSGSVITAALNGNNGNNFGDVTGSNTGQPFYVRQFTGGGITSIFEDGGVGSSNITEWRDASHGQLALIKANGMFGTVRFVGAGTLSPLFDLHIKESVQGTVHLRAENNGVINDELLDKLNTTDGANHVLHSWVTSSNKAYLIEGDVIARQTNNAGGNQHKAYGAHFFAVYHNIAGVLAQAGNPALFGKIADIPLANHALVINGINLELQVNGGGAGVNVTWHLHNMEFIEV